MKVYIERKVANYFNKIYLRHSQVETGGLLLGFKTNNKYLVVDYIESNQISDEYSIKFDYGLCKMAYLNKVQDNRYVIDIIGVWHIHVGECVDLSIKDIDSLNQINEITQQSILSVLLNSYGILDIKIAECSNRIIKEINEIIIFEKRG